MAATTGDTTVGDKPQERPVNKAVATVDPAGVAGIEAMLGNLVLAPADPVGDFNKPMIVCDVNGVLLKRARKATVPEGIRDADFKAVGYHVWRRPNVDSFMDFLLEHFTVVIWTSMMSTNAEALLTGCIGAERRRRLYRVLHQEHCESDPEPDYSKNHGAFLKRTEKLLADRDVNPNGYWHENNVRIIDDSVRKLRFNPKHTSMVILEYDFANPKPAKSNGRGRSSFFSRGGGRGRGRGGKAQADAPPPAVCDFDEDPTLLDVMRDLAAWRDAVKAGEAKSSPTAAAAQ